MRKNDNHVVSVIGGSIGGGGEIVHADEVQKLIAAIIELGGGVTRRSTWYRG